MMDINYYKKMCCLTTNIKITSMKDILQAIYETLLRVHLNSEYWSLNQAVFFFLIGQNASLISKRIGTTFLCRNSSLHLTD